MGLAEDGESMFKCIGAAQNNWLNNIRNFMDASRVFSNCCLERSITLGSAILIRLTNAVSFYYILNRVFGVFIMRG